MKPKLSDPFKNESYYNSWLIENCLDCKRMLCPMRSEMNLIPVFKKISFATALFFGLQEDTLGPCKIKNPRTPKPRTPNPKPFNLKS